MDSRGAVVLNVRPSEPDKTEPVSRAMLLGLLEAVKQFVEKGAESRRG